MGGDVMGEDRDDLVHFSRVPFVALCGADKANQRTTQVAKNCNCAPCLRLLGICADEGESPTNGFHTSDQDIALARYQNPSTKEWWRITRDGESRNCHLESISERSLERELTWAYACALTIERNEYANTDRVRAEMEAYLAMQNGDGGTVVAELVGAVVSDFTKEELVLGERLFDLQPDSPWTAFCEMRELFGAMSLERRQELYDVVAKRRAEGACCIHPVERHAYNGCADCGCGVLWTEHPDRDLDMSQAALDARAFRMNKALHLSEADCEHARYGCLVEDIDKALEGKEPRAIAQYALERLSNALALIRPSPYAGCTVANHDADELREFINVAKYAIDKAVPR